LYILLQATVLKSSFKDLIFNFADFVGVILSQSTQRVVDSLPEKFALKKERRKVGEDEKGKWRRMLL
jgi:hypothetical protein